MMIPRELTELTEAEKRNKIHYLNSKDKILFSPLSFEDYSRIVPEEKDDNHLKKFYEQTSLHGKDLTIAHNELFEKNDLVLIRNSEGSLDKEIMKNYDIDDLDLDSILRYRKKVEMREKYRYFKDFSLEKFLEQIGVVVKDYDGDGKRGVTAGGLLFFGKNTPIIYKFPYFQMELFDYRSDSRWKHRISTVSDNLNLYQFF